MRTLLAFLLVGAALSAQSEVPIDDEQVRVLVVSDKPGQKSGLHQHTVNRVMVYLDAGEMALAYEGGKTQRLKWKAGEALWSAGGGMHTSENTGGTSFRIVEVELKRKPTGAAYSTGKLDPLKTDPKRYRLEFENDQVRVIRARYAPRDKGAMHEHVLPRVAVFLTPQRMKVTTPDGKVSELSGEAGRVLKGGAATHIEENLSDRPFEVLVIELKP